MLGQEVQFVEVPEQVLQTGAHLRQAPAVPSYRYFPSEQERQFVINVMHVRQE